MQYTRLQGNILILREVQLQGEILGAGRAQDTADSAVSWAFASIALSSLPYTTLLLHETFKCLIPLHFHAKLKL